MPAEPQGEPQPEQAAPAQEAAANPATDAEATKAAEAESARAQRKREEAVKQRRATIYKDGLPFVETNGPPTRDASKEIFDAILKANDPPVVFVRGDELVRVNLHEEAKISNIDVNRLSHRVARVINCISTSKDRGTVHVHPPERLLKDILSYQAWPSIPPIEGIVTAPVVGIDGTLALTPGYLPNARVYYHQPASFALPDTTPTAASVKAALHLLQQGLMADFPFVDEASRANALGMLLLPFVRPYIRGSTPLHIIDAPTKGTGKSLLARIAMMVYYGREPGAITPPGPFDKEEWRKLITTQMDEGGPFFFLDNISGALKSAELELALTSPSYSGRRMGFGQMVKAPVRCVFIGTSNNIELVGDLDRRTTYIRLDSHVERPYERTGFKIGDLATYALSERPRLMAACLTLIRAWIEEGRPRWSKNPIGSFEEWSFTIGGILETIGIGTFQGNREELYDRSDPERAKWSDFVAAWFGNFGEKEVTVGDVIGFALVNGIVDNTEQKGKISLGALLKNRIDQIINGRRIYSPKGRKQHGSVIYQLVTHETAPMAFEDGESEKGGSRGSRGSKHIHFAIVPETNAETEKRTIGDLVERDPLLPLLPPSDSEDDVPDLADPFSPEDYATFPSDADDPGKEL